MKKRIGIISAVLLSCALIVGVTYAVLSSSSRPIVNTFTVGDISISLTESTGTSYKLIPGVTHAKDPRITVHSGSEACWLFFKLEKTVDLDDYISYSVAGEWTALEQESGVYWIKVPAASSDRVFPVLRDDRITVRESVTEEVIASLTEQPTIKFYAYAIQSDGIDTPDAAWQAIKQ